MSRKKREPYIWNEGDLGYCPSPIGRDDPKGFLDESSRPLVGGQHVYANDTSECVYCGRNRYRVRAAIDQNMAWARNNLTRREKRRIGFPKEAK